MNSWRKLDLSGKAGHPPADMLTALYLDPGDGRSEYDIGCFKTDRKDNGRKLWWHGRSGIQDPVRMKKHCTIWWCPVAEFDGR